ncbi:MAG: SpoIIE family protein phosphatase [Ignavibacteria bacterium]|nr:SpoIIE family protein phosphatase [Ignavibacteria bacterium]
MLRFSDDHATRRWLFAAIIIAACVTVVLRMAGVSLWCVVGGHEISDNIWIEIALTAASDLIIAGLVGVTILHFRHRLRTQNGNELVVSASTLYAVSTLALLLMSGIVGFNLERGRIERLVDVVSVHAVAVGVYIVSIGLAGLLVALAATRRQRITGRLVLVGIMLVGIWVSSILEILSNLFNVAAIALAIVVAIVLLSSIGRLNWLPTLTLDKKLRLLWLSMCGAFASSVLSALLLFDQTSFVTLASQHFLRKGSVLPAVINIIGFLFFVRLFIGTLIALPNSGIVDRRSSEVSSLTKLTRLVAESASVHQLLSSVTKYSLDVCSAHGAWCELYEDNEIVIVGAELIHPDYVTSLRLNRNLNRLFTATDKPILIESLAYSNPDATDGSPIRSLITIPLVAHHKRAGTLVMFSTVEFGFDQEDLRLLTAFADTIGVGLDQARLREAEIENERLQKEFEVARNIQASLLPRTAPKIDGCDIDAITIPAAQVGGDYFDYVRFESGNIGTIIADVSGKGVPAALYMATLKGIVLAEMRSSRGPADLLKRINATFSGSLERSIYISIMCVEVDTSAMQLKVARAGHTPALMRLQGNVVTFTPKGIAIGIVPPDQFDSIIEEIEVDVSPGDLCLLTTDGVNERRNGAMNEMTFAPVETMLASMHTISAAGLIRETLKLLDEHGEGTDQHDDITIVSLAIGFPSDGSANVYAKEIAGEQG